MILRLTICNIFIILYMSSCKDKQDNNKSEKEIRENEEDKALNEMLKIYTMTDEEYVLYRIKNKNIFDKNFSIKEININASVASTIEHLTNKLNSEGADIQILSPDKIKNESGLPAFTFGLEKRFEEYSRYDKPDDFHDFIYDIKNKEILGSVSYGTDNVLTEIFLNSHGTKILFQSNIEGSEFAEKFESTYDLSLNQTLQKEKIVYKTYLNGKGESINIDYKYRLRIGRSEKFLKERHVKNPKFD